MEIQAAQEHINHGGVWESGASRLTLSIPINRDSTFRCTGREIPVRQPCSAPSTEVLKHPSWQPLPARVRRSQICISLVSKHVWKHLLPGDLRAGVSDHLPSFKAENVYTTVMKSHSRVSGLLIKTRFRITMSGLMKYAVGFKDLPPDSAK